MYIFIILLSAILFSFYDILKKVSLRKSNIYEVLFFYCLAGFLFSLVFSFSEIKIDFISIVIIFTKSLIIVIDWILVIKALERLDVGIVSPLSLVSTVLVVFGSFIIFKERIEWTHILSLIFISSGVVLITFLEKKEKKEKNNWFILLLLLAALLASISSLLDKYLLIVRELSNKTVLVWFMLFNTVLYFIIYKFKNKKIEWKKVKENYWMILAGIAMTLSDIFYYLALEFENSELSLITILRKSSVVFSTILASIFLKEKNLLKKLGILLIMLVGVVVPIIFKE